MANFAGGSVYVMVQSIATGALLVTQKTFKRLTREELQQLVVELDRQLRLTRVEIIPSDDVKAFQLRQRTLMKFTSTLMMLRAYQQRKEQKLRDARF